MRVQVNVDDKHMGSRVAGSDDTRQADFFKGFAAELETYYTKSDIEFQFLSVAKKLTKDEKEVLQVALSCLWEEEEKK